MSPFRSDKTMQKKKKNISAGELTISDVNSGGLSLMSVTLMTAVAVLDRPYSCVPSMSVAWMISVYCGTF